MRLVVFHVLFSCAFRRLIFSADTYFLRAFYFVFSSSLLIYRCRILSSRLINFSSLHSYFVCDAVYDAPSLHVKYGKKKHYSLQTYDSCEKLPTCTHIALSRSGGPAIRRRFCSPNSNGLQQERPKKAAFLPDSVINYLLID